MARDERPLAVLGEVLYQGIAIDVTSVEGLADRAVSMLSADACSALRAYLEKALIELSPSELKGALNRTNSTVGFNSKGADQFLRATLERLRRG